MSESMPIDPVFSTEAARIIHVSVETIRAWERSGKLPALKTERGVRVFDRRDCERIAREYAARHAAQQQLEPAGTAA